MKPAGADRAWFVVYTFTLYRSNDPNIRGREVMRRGEVLLRDHGPSNIVLIGIHPITWAARQPMGDPEDGSSGESSLYYVKKLLFFSGIPKSAIGREVEEWTDVQKWPRSRKRSR